MLRFPNPGSTTASFVSVYKAAYDRLDGQVFNLDQSVAATVAANLATSSGHMGTEAISRSTRQDRSRDPLYNQLKMYAELFRALGWLHPTTQSALNFTFTLLGRQIVAAEQHYLPLLGETVLGISYPTRVLTTRGNHTQRPFAFMLLTMRACGDALSRDEMIVGPLSAASDRSEDAVTEMAEFINSLRDDPTDIKDVLGRVAEEQGIQVNTLKNYTRWPIAVMRDLGWTQKTRMRYTNGRRSFEVHQLTDLGKEIAQWVAAATDLRLDQVEQLSLEEKTAVSMHAHYRMLERSGFNLEAVNHRLGEQEPALDQALTKLNVPKDRPLLFSPFQSLSIADIARIFPLTEPAAPTGDGEAPAGGTVQGRGSRHHLFVEPRFVTRTEQGQGGRPSELEEELREIRDTHQSIEEAATAFALSRESDTQSEFYPLISGLFRLLGFESENSRPGVNYQRWDGWVDLEGVIAPIEIKSPTEEKFLSTKAVRQALENKIILLARGGLDTSAETSTLIVGYQIPNQRGEMSSLIDDVFEAFDISIGVIDLRTLALLAIQAVTGGQTIASDQLRTLRGFLHVSGHPSP